MTEPPDYRSDHGLGQLRRHRGIELVLDIGACLSMRSTSGNEISRKISFLRS